MMAAMFSREALNPGVRMREVFGWAMYDFANSGYTTVVITAVFAAYFVGGVADGAPWATLAWTSGLSLSYLIVMLTMPGSGPGLTGWRETALAYGGHGRLRAQHGGTVHGGAGPGGIGFVDPGHLQHLLFLWRVFDRIFFARAGQAARHGTCEWLGLGFGLHRGHAHTGGVLGLCVGRSSTW